MLLKKSISSLLIASFLVAGCAATQSQFMSKRYSLEDTKVCRNYISDREKLFSYYEASDADEQSYIVALQEEIKRRNLSATGCEALIEEENNKIAEGVLIGIVAIGAAAAAADSAGYSNGYSSYSGTGYAWDQFYDGYGNLTWRCRDKSNGQFAYSSSCFSEMKNDYTWPDK